ncbi:hypothetical protein Syun_012250 [Stephania yunnanensis]|uniref:K Homology domain-containing protein n=1 Tax=Stephania yunnanensis TaxID=152371 RepID=A0AAP0K045_9MAGN
MPDEKEDSHVAEQQQSNQGVKRVRSADFSGEDELDSKRRARSHEVLFRIVVPSRQIGRVIGKEGCRIRIIREQTKAAIKIADAISRHEERVVIISSNDNGSEISDAENALNCIARVILQESDGNIEPSKHSPGNVAINIIRLLIAGSQAGCLIGKSGQNIEKLRSYSGATIMILPQNQLPLCASAHESDRLVQISGGVAEVLKALEKIGCQLRENPPSKVISIRPMYSSNSLGHPNAYLPPTSGTPILQLIL